MEIHSANLVSETEITQGKGQSDVLLTRRQFGCWATLATAALAMGGFEAAGQIFEEPYTAFAAQTQTACKSKHVVREGENISKIIDAEGYQETSQQLAYANDIENPDLIHEGQVLQHGICPGTPVAKKATTSETASVVTVGGDGLEGWAGSGGLVAALIVGGIAIASGAKRLIRKK